MVANFDPSKRQRLPIIDVGEQPPSTVDIMQQLKLSMAKQSLFDQLDAMSRQQPDFLGAGYVVRLDPAAYTAAAIWSLDWVLADNQHRSGCVRFAGAVTSGYSADLAGSVTSVTVSFNGRRLVRFERMVKS